MSFSSRLKQYAVSVTFSFLHPSPHFFEDSALHDLHSHDAALLKDVVEQLLRTFHSSHGLSLATILRVQPLEHCYDVPWDSQIVWHEQAVLRRHVPAPQDPAQVRQFGVGVADAVHLPKFRQQPLPSTRDLQAPGPALLRLQCCLQKQVVYLRRPPSIRETPLSRSRLAVRPVQQEPQSWSCASMSSDKGLRGSNTCQPVICWRPLDAAAVLASLLNSGSASGVSDAAITVFSVLLVHADSCTCAYLHHEGLGQLVPESASFW